MYIFVYTANFNSNSLVVTPSLPGSCDQSDSTSDWSLGLLECAYVHEYVLSIAVSVGVPEAPASHSETENDTHILVIWCCLGDPYYMNGQALDVFMMG